jgi:hypothetical protein
MVVVGSAVLLPIRSSPALAGAVWCPPLAKLLNAFMTQEGFELTDAAFIAGFLQFAKQNRRRN